MKRFVVRKNTLPCVQQWSVIDTKTGNRAGNYKNEETAQRACEACEYWGNQTEDDKFDVPLTIDPTKQAIDILEERMKKPEGDSIPKPPRHSNSRRVELD